MLRRPPRRPSSRRSPRALRRAGLPLLALAAWGGLALLAAAGCRGAGAGSVEPLPAAGENLVVRRGDLAERVLLTGELKAARADELSVPRTSQGQLQIRWMIEDGAAVAAGDRLVELDNSPFTSEIEEKRLTAAQAADDLARAEAEAAATEADKVFAVEQKKADLAKARLAAGVPEGLLAEREVQEGRLAAQRAALELQKAETELATHRRGSAADLAVQRINLAKSRREIADAEAAITALVLRAPRAGLAVVAEHPWEGRKLRVGDSLWAGITVVRIPDLTSLEVEARLSDVDDGRLAVGQRAVCTLDAYPGEPFGARVAEVSPVAQESARSSLLRSFTVRLVPDRLDPRRMRPGLSVKVAVAGRGVSHALLAPRAGLDLAADPPRARLAAGGEARVEVGLCDAQRCAVSGLAEGTLLRAAPDSVAGDAA